MTDTHLPEVRRCGVHDIPLVENPHPDAGIPTRLAEVGAMWECVACLSYTRHRWSQRALAAEKGIAEATRIFIALGKDMGTFDPQFAKDQDEKDMLWWLGAFAPSPLANENVRRRGDDLRKAARR